jgi:hypothetical protein
LRDGLRIGVTDNKIHALNIQAVHVVNSIAAATTHTHYFDNG